MVGIEPIAGAPAARVDLPDERLLVLADYHAGFEAAARAKRGIELPSRATNRRERVLELVSQTDADRLVVLGDLTHRIGEPGTAERGELELLVEALDRPIVVAKGNHDGVLEELLATDTALFGDVTVLPATGARLGPLGVVHGHTWPDPSVIDAPIVCMGHEHPCVRLADEVGGSRVERVWLRGPLDRTAFREHLDDVPMEGESELVVFPAFNELCGGTWVNVPEQGFLAPFLPAALPEARAYLLDGTDLGPYRRL